MQTLNTVRQSVRHLSIHLSILINELVVHLILKQVLNDSSSFFFNSLIHLTLCSVFIYYAQQKFVMTLTLADQLIKITDRVKLQQQKELIFKLKCRLNRGETFNWRRKHKLSRFLEEQCKSRRDTKQKRFIISILTLIQKELKNFSIYWDQRLIQNIFLQRLEVHFLLNNDTEFNCSRHRFSALALSQFTVRCIRIVIAYCNLKLWLKDVYTELKLHLKENFCASFKRNCRHFQHNFLTMMCKNNNVFIFSVTFCSIIALIIILRKM